MSSPSSRTLCVDRRRSRTPSLLTKSMESRAYRRRDHTPLHSRLRRIAEEDSYRWAHKVSCPSGLPGRFTIFQFVSLRRLLDQEKERQLSRAEVRKCCPGAFPIPYAPLRRMPARYKGRVVVLR